MKEELTTISDFSPELREILGNSFRSYLGVRMAKHKYSKKSKMDERLGMKGGKESGMKQSYKSRRDESTGMKKSRMKKR